jgi:putative phosphoribosyl transferase
MAFTDRSDAGRRLARRLVGFRDGNVVVLGLPRGGVPVAFEVSQALGAPLDVLVVRKLGLPYQPELALGAIGEDGVLVLNEETLRVAQVTVEEMAAVERAERVELQRRVNRFRGLRERIPLTGRTAIIVDDGVATGATARAACRVARAQGAERVVLAVPVGAPDDLDSLAREADEVVCLSSPSWFFSVGQWYRDFRQTSDEEVFELMQRSAEDIRAPAAAAPVAEPSSRDEEVEVSAGRVSLAGHLTIPERPLGVVVFAHGSGSSRHSPRNRHVAGVLNQAGLGTLLFDLLTRQEERDRALVFDIELLAERLVSVTQWLTTRPETAHLRVGYFGASTGAAAALWAAADPGADVAAVVSRGGRADLAQDRLSRVHTPTLLIVGGRDKIVLQLNRHALAVMPCETRLSLVPGATHLFEEPGALDEVAELAGDWFVSHLAPAELGSMS